jgi:hypothetical protein
MGQFLFSYATDAGFSYVVQCSSNLVDWTPLMTNMTSGGPALFSEPLETTGTKFYRIGRMANP